MESKYLKYLDDYLDRHLISIQEELEKTNNPEDKVDLYLDEAKTRGQVDLFYRLKINNFLRGIEE